MAGTQWARDWMRQWSERFPRAAAMRLAPFEDPCRQGLRAPEVNGARARCLLLTL